MAVSKVRRTFIIAATCDLGPIGALIQADTPELEKECIAHYACTIECRGQLVEKAEWPKLYTVIGDQFTNFVPVVDDEGLCMDNDAITQWGTVEGSDFFRLPDFQARSK